MGFLSSEVNKLTFKVQAGNVIDASAGKYWYESIFPNNPALLANRVLTQFELVKSYPAANLAAAQAAATAIPSILEDRSTTSIRLTQAITGENNTWVAYATYSTPSSGILDLWVQPQRVPQTSGVPSGGYEIALYSGDPSSSGVYISTTIGQTVGGEVGWVFNYDMGLLFLANDLVGTIQSDTATYPAGLDFYIRGFRYIGETLADGNIGGGGGTVSFGTSSTIGFTQSGPTYSAYILDGSLTASVLNTGTSGGATAGYFLSNTSDGNFVWLPSVAGSSGTSGTSGSSGTSGTSGTSGSSGTSGTSGTSGSSGSSGTSGNSASVEFNNTDTISFSTQSIPGGLSASASINPNSLTASVLNTGSSGGATAGYVLSNTSDGNFAWVAPGAASANLSVSDYSNGTTFSNIENIVFRGGLVTTPGGTAMGVLAGAPTGSNSVTVWIPAPPQAVYASHFNTNDGNTTGTVTRTLSTSTVRISSPTTEGTPFETGGWAGTNQAATTTSTPTFQTGGLVTGFSGTSSGDARVIVDVFRADGVATFSTYTTPTLYQNAVHNNGVGIIVTIGSYATDDSGFPSIYTTKYKATVSVSVNMLTIFNSYGLVEGGRYSVRIKFITDTLTDGGSTYTATSTSVFYDTNPNTPSIGGTTSVIESTNSSNILTKHISGVEYYITGSQFELTTTGINNLNKNTQGFSSGTSKNFTITGVNYNLPQRDLQAWAPSVGTFVGWLNNFDNTGITFSYTSWAISSSATYRYRGSGAVAVSQPFDPWGTGLGISSTSSSVLIDQVSDNSTRLGESFNGETERLVRGSSTFSAWDSTATLGTSISNQTGTGPFCDACVVGGYLVRPDKYFLSAGLSTLQPNLTSYKPDKNGANPNYSSHTQIATYHRRFYTASVLKNITSFSIAFSGTYTGYTDFYTALANSQLKVYIRRISSPTGNYGPTAPPLSLHGGVYDISYYLDGNNGVDTLSSLIRLTGSGNTIYGTFGGDVSNIGFWMELQIVDSAIKIDYINVTLTFDDSTSDSATVV